MRGTGASGEGEKAGAGSGGGGSAPVIAAGGGGSGAAGGGGKPLFAAGGVGAHVVDREEGEEQTQQAGAAVDSTLGRQETPAGASASVGGFSFSMGFTGAGVGQSGLPSAAYGRGVGGEIGIATAEAQRRAAERARLVREAEEASDEDD